MISKHRKAVTKINEALKFRIGFAEQITKALAGCCTKKKAKAILNNPIQITPELREKCCAALQSFCEQTVYDDFIVYANNNYCEVLMPVHEQFFKEIQMPNSFVQLSIPKRIGKIWGEMSLFEKQWHESNLVFTASYTAYGCKLSPWHPEKPIDVLIEQLQLHGPHFVEGRLGSSFYEENPFQLSQKIEGRPVFGWKPNAKRINEDSLEFHVVVIVGAKVDNEKKFVYFIDPQDGSDPSNITTQKIYIISYERFRSSICNLFGMQLKTLDGKIAFEDVGKETNNYALYK
ncbi:MAG: hypothetical protein WCP39_06390 [Chlamydiota bacterium]